MCKHTGTPKHTRTPAEVQDVQKGTVTQTNTKKCAETHNDICKEACRLVLTNTLMGNTKTHTFCSKAGRQAGWQAGRHAGRHACMHSCMHARACVQMYQQ